MEEKKEYFGMLDLMIRPGFSVENNIITSVNAAAEALLISPGTDVRDLLQTGKEEYEAFPGGCLYLLLNLTDSGVGACVTRMGGQDIFVLDQEESELKALALAAVELRQPLLNIMLCADRLSPSAENQELLGRMNRGIHQIHRILNNMSDAGRFAALSRPEIQNMGSVFSEIFEKAQTLLAHTGTTLSYQGLQEEVYTLADREQLERAVLNILSNAVKFSPQGGKLEASLTRRGKMLRLSIQDRGCGIGENLMGSVFSRYLRQPGIEDSRFGLGLGMVLVRSAALSHGGTVLIDQPEGNGTRVTMTIELRQSQETTLHLPIELPAGHDLGLIELSDCLPPTVYEK